MTPESLSLIEPKTAKPRSATDCPRCDAWWTGLNTAHCAACYAAFTGITAFDAHRTGSHTETGESIVDKGHTEPRGPRRCIAPESVGLIDAGRAYPCWGFPGTDTHWTNENPQETQ